MAVLGAYMFSIQVYKIWYLAAAALAAIIWIILPVRDGDYRQALLYSWHVIAYFTLVFLSGYLSDIPEVAYRALLIDAIYPLVFVIFYLVGATSRPQEIARALRLLIWAGAAATIVFWGAMPTRDGVRMVHIVPYVIPFCFVASVRLTLRSAVETAVAIGFLLIARSRAPLAAGVLTSLGAIAIVGVSARERIRNFAIIGGLGALALTALALVPATRGLLLRTWVRLSGMPVEFGGYHIPAEGLDLARERVADTFAELAGDPGPLGIGYGNFVVFMAERFPAEEITNLHSIYQVWWLETGWIGALAAAAMLATFFMQCWWSWRRSEVAERRYFVALALSMAAVLLVGLFHQMHQLPMMFVLLGLAAGGCSQQARMEQSPER